ncbi:MAG: invasin domain 3-containing protein [bacterium]
MRRFHPLVRIGLFVVAAAAILTACDSVTDEEPIDIRPFNDWSNATQYLPADGESELDIQVTAITYDGERVENVVIEFTTTAGTLTQDRVITNASGEASTTLMSVISTTDITAQVDATVYDTSGYILNPRTNSQTQVQPAPEESVALVSVGPMTEEEMDARLHAILVDRARENARSRERGASSILGEPRAQERGQAAGSDEAEADQLTVIFEGIQITLSTDKTSVVADGTSSTAVEARVRTVTRGQNLTGRQIDWSAIEGKITPASNTNQFGIASATFTSVLTTSPADTVYAMLVPGIEAQTAIPYDQPDLTLSAAETVLPADGSSTTQITARLLGPNGTPVEDAQVDFSLAGVSDAVLTLVDNGRTDTNGEAAARLRAGQASGTATVTATFSSLTTSTTVNIQDLQLTMTASPNQILADDSNTSQISVLVKTASTNTGVGGVSVQFTTTLGSIPLTATTNSSGEATVTLAADTNPGTATITATVGPNSTTTTVEMLPKDLTIALEAATTTGILRDGADDVDLTISVQDPAGKKVSSLPVTWSTTAGSISPTSGSTNTNGQHTATLKADAGTADQTATVTAAVGDSTRTLDMLFKGITITSDVSPDTLLANGEQSGTMTFRATETSSGIQVGNHPIAISKVSGPSVILNDVPTSTSDDGTASFSFTSSNAGDLVMQAAMGGGVITDTETIHLLQDQISIRLSADEGSLLRDGQDETTIRAEVRNRFNQAIDGQLVQFGLTGDGELLEPYAETNEDGVATTKLRADVATTVSSATVTATVSTVSENVVIPLYGVRFSIKATPDTLVADGMEESLIEVTVKEAETNVPLEGRIVNFSFAPGDFATIDAQAITNDRGVATATLTADTTAAVDASVKARLGSDPSTTLGDSVAVYILPQTLIPEFTSGATTRILRNGEDATTLTVEVTDNAGKVVPNATVNWSTSTGSLDKTTSTTDNAGQASVTLTGDDGSADATATVTADVNGSTDTQDVDLVGLTLDVTETIPTRISANGVATSEITVQLVETTAKVGVSDETIVFSTDLGTITGSVSTDSDGKASATLTSGLTAGTATVTATNGVAGGSITATTQVTLEAPTTASIGLSTSTTDLQVKGTGGTETATITATLLDGDNKPVPPGVLVDFEMSPAGGTAGLFNGTADSVRVETDDNGEAKVQFQSGTVATDVTVTAEAVGTGITASQSLLTVSAGPTANIDVSGVEIVFSQDTGQYERELHAVLSDTYGNSIPDANVLWTASPDTVGGIIANSTTDEKGVAQTFFTYARGYEVLAVTYSATNQGVTSTLAVPLGSLTLVSDSSSILRDGVDSTALTATLADAFGTPVAQSGIGFSLSGANGTLASAAVGTDQDGEAANVFTADANTADETETVNVSFLSLSDSVVIGLRGVTLSVEASPDSISANGSATSTITATLKETTANVALDGRTVSFATDVGTVSGSGTTDASGKAISTFTSPSTAGAASVSAVYGGLSPVSTTVTLLGTTSTTLGMEASETELQVLGTGGTERSIITVTVWDANNNPMPAGTEVNLAVSPDGTFSNGQADITKLTDGNGQVSFEYQSGSTSGTMTFTATAVASGAQSVAGLINVTAGPPAQILLTYDPTDATSANGVTSLPISALVSDAANNAVLEGTLLYFTITAGGTSALITGSAATDDAGLAQATLSYPDGESGTLITIEASTANGVSATLSFNLP